MRRSCVSPDDVRLIPLIKNFSPSPPLPLNLFYGYSTTHDITFAAVAVLGFDTFLVNDDKLLRL